jgi:hypothetical protein
MDGCIYIYTAIHKKSILAISEPKDLIKVFKIILLVLLTCFYYKNMSFGIFGRKKKNSLPIYLPTSKIVVREIANKLQNVYVSCASYTVCETRGRHTCTDNVDIRCRHTCTDNVYVLSSWSMSNFQNFVYNVQWGLCKIEIGLWYHTI